MRQSKEHVTISPRGMNASLLTICSKNKLFEGEIEIIVEWDKLAFRFAGLSSTRSRKLAKAGGGCYQTTVPVDLNKGSYDIVAISEDELICQLT